LSVSIRDTEEGNAAMIFGERALLKFFRRPGPDVNPELEISHFLTQKNFPHSPKLLGALEYRDAAKTRMTVAVAKAFVPHATNGWKFTLDATTRYYDQVFADAAQGHGPESAQPVGPLKSSHHNPPEQSGHVTEHVETYLNPRACSVSGRVNCISRCHARKAASFTPSL